MFWNLPDSMRVWDPKFWCVLTVHRSNITQLLGRQVLFHLSLQVDLTVHCTVQLYTQNQFRGGFWHDSSIALQVFTSSFTMHIHMNCMQTQHIIGGKTQSSRQHFIGNHFLQTQEDIAITDAAYIKNQNHPHYWWFEVWFNDNTTTYLRTTLSCIWVF